MKNILIISILVIFPYVLFTQTIPSIILDSSTGNYIIRYQNYAGEYREVIYEPPTKIEPFVQSLISYNQDSLLFKYEYIITNSVNSRQRLLTFAVNYYSPIKSINRPNEQWTFGHHHFDPVFEWSHTMVSSYGVLTPNSGIAPDSSVKDFSFKSKGLPCLVKSYFMGAVKTLGFPDEAPEGIFDVLDPIYGFPNATVKKFTLGPKDPPDPFIVNDFVDTLISYKHQAFELGWIDNQGILNSLDSKLDNIKKQLEKDQTTTAINGLKAFVNEVEAKKDKHLTSEAYGLLKYNAEYLVEKLSE